ncbi:MAG: pyruvate formate-lyase 1-activating enzyme, partial [Planctomycetota bacterium]
AELVHGLPTRPPVYVLPFHRLGRDKYARLGRNDTMSAFEPPRPEQVAGVARHLREAGLSVHLGG